MLGRLSPFPFGMAKNFQHVCSTSGECFSCFFATSDLFFWGGMSEDLRHCFLKVGVFLVSVFFLFGGGTLDVSLGINKNGSVHQRETCSLWTKWGRIL